MHPGVGVPADATQGAAEHDARPRQGPIVAEPDVGLDGAFGDLHGDHGGRAESHRLGTTQQQVGGSRIMLVGPLDEVGGIEEADAGAGGRAGPGGTVGRPDQRSDGQLADLGDVAVVGYRVEGVDIVPGDDVDDLLTVTRERRPQVGSNREVPCLAVAARQRLVGDLPQHLLGESVVPPLRRPRIGGHLQDLAAQQLGEDRLDGRGRQAGHAGDGLGRKAAPQHGCAREHLANLRVEGIEPRRQQGVEAVGNFQLTDVTDDAVDAFDRPHHVAVDECPNALHGVERECPGRARRSSNVPAREIPE